MTCNDSEAVAAPKALFMPSIYSGLPNRSLNKMLSTLHNTSNCRLT